MPNFLNVINHLQFLALSIIILGISWWKLEVGQPKYRAWSDCTEVQAGLALYWWQRLITFGVGRIRVNLFTWLHPSKSYNVINIYDGKIINMTNYLYNSKWIVFLKKILSTTNDRHCSNTFHLSLSNIYAMYATKFCIEMHLKITYCATMHLKITYCATFYSDHV